MPEGKPPKAFISYKWEGPETSEWLDKFARDLRRNGVDAFLEVWEVEFGGSFIKYMTRNIPDADVFFFVMTAELHPSCRGSRRARAASLPSRIDRLRRR